MPTSLEKQSPQTLQDNPHGPFPNEIMLRNTPTESYRIPPSTTRRLDGLSIFIYKWGQYQRLLYRIILRITPDTITWKCLTSTDKLPVNVSGNYTIIIIKIIEMPKTTGLVPAKAPWPSHLATVTTHACSHLTPPAHSWV